MSDMKPGVYVFENMPVDAGWFYIIATEKDKGFMAWGNINTGYALDESVMMKSHGKDMVYLCSLEELGEVLNRYYRSHSP